MLLGENNRNHFVLTNCHETKIYTKITTDLNFSVYSVAKKDICTTYQTHYILHNDNTIELTQVRANTMRQFFLSA